MMTQAVAILPARGGSKRIPQKNIKPFLGRPALEWPLQAARQSGVFSRLVVSTDDDDIAAAARTAGAEVPFRRDAALSDDHVGMTEVLRDAVLRLDIPHDTPVCCIYPTAFFLTADDLARGHALLMGGAQWVLALGAYRTPIDRAYSVDPATGRAVARDPAGMPRRSQDLAPAYFDVGAMYWALSSTWRDPSARVWNGAAAVVIPAARAIDIDTPEDWDWAERLVAMRAGP